MQELINLLDVIIWPLTVLAGLLFFREHIGKVIGSLGSIKAGAQGFEMNFIDDKLQEASKLIGLGSLEITAKDGSSIIPKDGSSIIPKDSKIVPKKSHAETPYQELMELQDAINQTLKNMAATKGIATNGASNFALTTTLADHDIINNQKARQLKTLIELNNIGLNSPKITSNQVIQMKTLFNKISL
ncbi:hypothetical protein [Hwangdonia seohaensis]|uniref:Uncharacterized protein n=1 Tax=Hwangdonia seohaensis TaxID=1240727 RepID=A0ABW3RFL0_9FLAO|nr:hypothetical protein [Hwangdonia seohaensis]